MKIRKIAYQLHLWLGLISGLIVFVVCLTGAIWALKLNGWVDNDELKTHKTNGQHVLLEPSWVIDHASKAFKGNIPNSINYTKDSSIGAYYRGKDGGYSLQMNPFTRETLSIRGLDGKYLDFWEFIGAGHFSLWLPYNIGRPIVGYGTLVFAIVLLTGLVLWLPKSKKALKNSLRFNWKKETGTQRKMYDLHNVFGFYTAFILLIICLTGMVWGVEWWSNGLYKITSGGRELPEWRMAQSDTTSVATSVKDVYAGIDSLFSSLVRSNPRAEAFMINLPDNADKSSAIMITVFPEKKLYYNADRYSFDKYTFKPIQVSHPYQGRYQDKDFADKLRRMNYDIHIGAIGGTAGRLLVFLSTILGMSLPLTGFYLFIKKKSKKKKSKIIK